VGLQPTVAPAGLVSVTVLATDPLTSEGTTACLHSCPQIEPIPASEAGRADVVLVMAGTVTEDTMDLLRRVAEGARRGP
jgi:hypothetical protein